MEDVVEPEESKVSKLNTLLAALLKYKKAQPHIVALGKLTYGASHTFNQ